MNFIYIRSTCKHKKSLIIKTGYNFKTITYHVLSIESKAITNGPISCDTGTIRLICMDVSEWTE